MTRKLILATVIMLSLTIVGCSSNTATNSKPNNETNVEENNNSNKDNTAKEEKPQENKGEKEEKESKITLSIYNEDADTMELKEIATIEVNEKSSLEDKLKDLSKSLSEKTFDKLPIEVKSIDTVDGKKIATINLTDSNNEWVQKFQGSTGGQVTSDSLIETFLQVKAKGEWIDGVKFLYKNEPIEYEHASTLSEVQYRN